MGNTSSYFLSDEEMGKKDDDHKRPDRKRAAPLSAATGPVPPRWTLARLQPRKTLKRLLLLAVVGLAVYVFVKNIPTDVPIRDCRRPSYRHPDLDTPPTGQRSPPRPPPRPIPDRHKGIPEPAPAGGRASSGAKTKKVDGAGEGIANGGSDINSDDGSARDYKGRVRFLDLAESLQAISNTKGSFKVNKNVLFAAASLKSAATLLPMACQMGMERRSYVHFALMSRSDIDMMELRKINSIDDSCSIIFHDARPELSLISTDSRLGESVVRALFHIVAYMHPQAIIVDSSVHEEQWFTPSIRKQSDTLRIPLIELPPWAVGRVSWLTKLDSASLAAWNNVNIDILIHATPGTAGSLIRLLKSLSSADFVSSSIPHLTIELPHNIDPPTERFLQTFQWPPPHLAAPSRVRQLSLRHRIPRRNLNEEEASVRFLESFWPATPHHSHVLLLSPQVELSPSFFHYLKYAILEYRYSVAAVLQEWDQRLLAISLELPSTYLNASGPFQPPTQLETVDDSGPVTPDSPTPFLWQAPSSNAVLISGEKWVELHGFVSRLLDVNHRFKSQDLPELLSDKVVSKKFPSWLEHALRLARARGYWTLYPSQPTSTVLATVHTEMYRPPEEYQKDLTKGDRRRLQGDGDDELGVSGARGGGLLDMLPGGGSLPPFKDMPIVSWDGTPSSISEFNNQALKYMMEFRRSVGGCTEDNDITSLKVDHSASDLFCNT